MIGFGMHILCIFVVDIRPVIEKVKLRIVQRFIPRDLPQVGNLDIRRCDGIQFTGIVRMKAHAV